MSRKNRNAKARKYKRTSYSQSFFQPSPLEQIAAGASSNAPASAATPNPSSVFPLQSVVPMTSTPAAASLIRCNDTCSYEFKALPDSVLETDYSYQRKIDEARVNRIVQNFDPRLVNEVKVSNRDGKFFVFDGAHTLFALKKVHKGEPFMVQCKVYYGLSYEEEAYLFALQSGETKDVAFNIRLRALLISNSEEANAFKNATSKAGFSLSESAGSATRYNIAAVAKAYKLYKEYGAEKYGDLLRLLADTFDGAGWSVTGFIMGGLAVFLREYSEEYNRERFIRKLKDAEYEPLRVEAKRQTGISSDVAHAIALMKMYNRSGGKGTVDPRKLTMLY